MADEGSAKWDEKRSIGREHATARDDYFEEWAMKNPLPATKKDSIVDRVSAMEFCFIYGKRLIFAL